MAKDTLVTSQRQFGGLSRIQLQAACVKLGLESTGENEALRRTLEDHWNKQHSRIESNQDHSMEVSTSDSVSFSETTLAMSEETSMEVPKDKDAIKAEDEQDDNRVGDSEEIVKLEVTDGPTTPPKTEEQVLVKTEHSEGEEEEQKKQKVDDNKMEVEESQGHQLQQQLRHTPEMVEVKMEEETFVKEEDEDALMEPKQEDKDDMEIDTKREPVKKEESEEPSRPVAARTKLWEAKTSTTISRTMTTPRSALPVRSANLNKILNRSTKPGEPNTEDKGEEVLPAAGTVRALVGRFASGSTASNSAGSPISKQKTGATSSSASASTLPKSSPKPRAAVPMIPRYKKVIKVPVASTSTASKSPYAMQPNGAASSTNTPTLAGTKRKSGSSDSSAMEDSAGSAVPAQKRKMVSVATINRLATPKKAKLSPPPSGLGSAAGPSGSSTTMSQPALNNSSSTMTVPPTTPTRPTRARGPVLSTASRAAQRQSRQRS